MTPAAMSRSRIAVKARPTRDRAMLRAASAKMTSSTSISQNSFWSRVKYVAGDVEPLAEEHGRRRGRARRPCRR